MIMITNLLFNFTSICVKSVSFLTKPLSLGNLFSTVVNAELASRPLILGILLSVSIILELKFAFF